MVRVSVSGWYGHGNVGDEAILAGILRSLYYISPKISVTVFSDNPEHTKYLHGVKSVKQDSTWRQPLEKTLVLWAYLSTHLFILGGGGFLSDWQSPSVPKLWLKRAWRAKTLGRKTMAYGIGAGPITTKEGFYWTQKVLNVLDIVTVRDSVSKEWLRRAGVKKTVYVTGDPALRLPVPREQQRKELIQRYVADPDKPIAAISLAPIFHIDKLWGGMKHRYARLVKDSASIVQFLHSELGLSVLMVPMHLTVDLPFYQAIVSKSKINRGVAIIDTQLSPSEVLGIYSDAEFLIANRLHSIILASLCSVPAIGIVIHHKTRCFLRDMGLEELSVPLGDGKLEDNVDLNLRKLRNSIYSVKENRERLEVEISSRIGGLRKREERNAALCASLLQERLLGKSPTQEL